MCTRFFDGVPFTHGSWWGNIVNRKPPRVAGFFRSNKFKAFYCKNILHPISSWRFILPSSKYLAEFFWKNIHFFFGKKMNIRIQTRTVVTITPSSTFDRQNSSPREFPIYLFLNPEPGGREGMSQEFSIWRDKKTIQHDLANSIWWDKQTQVKKPCPRKRDKGI